MPRGVAYMEMLGSVFPVYRRIAHCENCRMLVKEIADGCWVDYYVQSAQCPDGGMHTPLHTESWPVK